MLLHPQGEMIAAAWDTLLSRHSGVSIDTQITMPDHLHVIVVLSDDPDRTLSLSDVVHRFKSLTTKRYVHGVRAHGWPPFAGNLWQESFYDHVILEERELDAIRRYILENPLRWELRRTAGAPASE